MVCDMGSGAAAHLFDKAVIVGQVCSVASMLSKKFPARTAGSVATERAGVTAFLKIQHIQSLKTALLQGRLAWTLR